MTVTKSDEILPKWERMQEDSPESGRKSSEPINSLTNSKQLKTVKSAKG